MSDMLERMRELDQTHRLAIISGASFGCNDRDWVGLTFTVDPGCGGVRSVFVDTERSIELLREWQISDTKQLNGRPCWVDLGTIGLIRFVDLAAAAPYRHPNPTAHKYRGVSLDVDAATPPATAAEAPDGR